jgi:hypothetical protein
VYDRNSKRSPDQRYDTFAWLDRSNGGRVWELAVPDGRYEVFVVAGDPNRYDSTFRLEVEGILAVDGIARRNTRWLAGLVTVDVHDGRLTLRSGSGARNNKVCFLDLTQLAAGAGTAQLMSEGVPSVRLVTPAPAGPQRLHLSGIPGTRYRLQASSDFSEWSDMLLLQLNRAEFEMLDPDSIEEPLRFYRLLEDGGIGGAQ